MKFGVFKEREAKYILEDSCQRDGAIYTLGAVSGKRAELQMRPLHRRPGQQSVAFEK